MQEWDEARERRRHQADRKLAAARYSIKSKRIITAKARAEQLQAAEDEHASTIAKLHVRAMKLLQGLHDESEARLSQLNDELLAKLADVQRNQRWDDTLEDDFRPLLKDAAYRSEHPENVAKLAAWSRQGFHNLPAIKAEQRRRTRDGANQIMSALGIPEAYEAPEPAAE